MTLIAIVALILALGVASRVLADRLRIPSVLFLIFAGIVIGPEVLGIVSEDTFGGGLSAIVGVSVAIILFEGGYHLHLEKLRESPTALLRLTTVGAVITWLGTAAAVVVFLETSLEVGLLVGALLIATGPTVIGPILQVVTVRDHVASVLEGEGVINDITAAILVVVVFEVLIAGNGTPAALVGDFAMRLVIGLSFGALVAAVVWFLLDRGGSRPCAAPLHARLIVLAGIIVAYAGAETLASETGIAAAAMAGFALGNVDLPYHEDVIDFLDDLSVVVLSFIFIALAALIDFADIRALGLAGLAIVVAITLVLRPAVIYLSTTNARFTHNERLFLSAVGPRGIIPASVATLFAVELQALGRPQEAQLLAGTVFLIIFATVVLQAGLARQIANYLDVSPMRTILVGGGRVGLSLAERLEQDGENVLLIDNDPAAVETARKRGIRAMEGNGTDAAILEQAGADDAKSVIATTPDDDVNLLVCQLAKTTFDVETVASRVNQPDNVDAFESLGVHAIDLSMATAWSLENVLERPSLSAWMNELGRTGDVQEIEVTATELVGKTIATLNAEIPEGVIVGLLTHQDGTTEVPTGDHELRDGDRVTFIGQTDAVERAIKRFHPHD
ncbi:Kef-type transport system (probable substrate potassium) (plasmid) [Natrialba magadii ATCC 43099]|uniref:Kef-type transport system (Probable substrate potassium) n=1 Tax=Natrialba magadii (strain ATCC 43099 / DSM 3394 / CCM 3739 / CIP 104546 / IAM 13178 / JCM 8861 / NBRC 102185 / NCIMB 2190 / MS3) TaxID=547559 RepID=D3T105_NATMM|nr:cation:proton antiporter [Natrialba magadii]ADD07264.1 Kef-type transport system (probable substrate potassium) [Natrialba magadii ATCC 43099]ELY34373.1 TrkA-N domain-containing protein [Natrialba magadii ATCC 43099]